MILTGIIKDQMIDNYMYIINVSFFVAVKTDKIFIVILWSLGVWLYIIIVLHVPLSILSLFYHTDYNTKKAVDDL